MIFSIIGTVQYTVRQQRQSKSSNVLDYPHMEHPYSIKKYKYNKLTSKTYNFF